jgi:CPA2 family monovalent cation:H+ antiporter-2
LKAFVDEDEPMEISADVPKQNHVVVCGYGRVGSNLVRLLQEHQYPVVVIDQSESRIQQVREAGVPYVYGNAASLHVLEKAGVEQAQSLAIALPDPMSSRLCVKRALELSPKLDVVVRATKDKDIELLYQLGAREVVQPEFEASLELANHLLTCMGLSPLAIQREMQQIRSHHYLELRPERTPSEVSRELQLAAQDLNSRWYALPAASPLTGMTLEEADIRYLTGVSLMAIRRANGQEVDYPNAQTILEKGDRLLLVGSAEELAALEELAKGEATVPEANAACHWVTVAADSPFLGHTLAQLDIRRGFGVQVQAIRRDGKFIRFPDGAMDLKTGDKLLLCGGYSTISQLQQLLAPTSPSQPISAVPVVKALEAEGLREFLPLDSWRE